MLTDRIARPGSRDASAGKGVVDGRVVFLSGLAIIVALAAGGVAVVLMRLIALITNIAFFGRVSSIPVSPADAHLGLLVIIVPVIGGLIVGVMARFGSKAIRGHGIPEAMEKVLFDQSRIPARLTILKPLSAAIAIGTGGPFGAEGPIIATGGALGSLLGQVVKITADERKTLLAAGAAAGMAATFGSPVAAVLLAIELLLFEYRPRSAIPVALAAVAADAVRFATMGSAPAFAMPNLVQPSGGALVAYVLIGALMGLASVGATRAVYWVEDAFEKLPIHWMWWPALGGVAVGVVGLVAPHTLGVGYDNIEHTLDGSLAGQAALVLCAAKFVSWCLSLGSGTSGGTLAPLFTIGGTLGSVLGAACIAILPSLGVDVRIAALVGMAAIFAGASRALLASVVFAFECTRQPLGLLPLLGGASAAFLVSSLLMKHSIMTEKIARRGARVASEYVADFFDQVLVSTCFTRDVTTLKADDTVEEIRARLQAGDPRLRHTGFPVLGEDGFLRGVVVRSDVFDLAADPSMRLGDLCKRPPVVVTEQSSLREAADRMVLEGIGRLVVVDHKDPRHVRGILTRSDVLGANKKRLEDARRAHIVRPLPTPRWATAFSGKSSSNSMR
jgi:H+/Cl- antiporter ClcA/CBS domain-containing protein